MTAPNDVAKQAIIDKVNKAIETEGLSVKHAAQCIGLRPAAISGMRKQKNWKAVGITEWDKARKWTNSGETLIKYGQKHIKDSDPVDPELLQKLMTTGKEAPAAAQYIPDHVKETGRRATEEEAEKIVDKTKAIAKEFDVPPHEVAKSPDKAPTHSMIDEIEEQVKSANEEGQYKPPDYTNIKEVEKDFIDEAKRYLRDSKLLDYADAQTLNQLREEQGYPPITSSAVEQLAKVSSTSFRVIPTMQDKKLKYKLQKKIMLVWWNVDVFSTQEEACSIALKLSDLRQTI